MTWDTSRRSLQATVAVLALIPLTIGGAGVLLGPAAFAPDGSWTVSLDSHFRYLSGIFLAVGLLFYGTVVAIERKTLLFRLGTALVFAGGLGRLYSLLTAGAPATPHVAGLFLELLVVPLLCLWQARIARAAALNG